jgi:hypothetical protein
MEINLGTNNNNNENVKMQYVNVNTLPSNQINVIKVMNAKDYARILNERVEK